MGRDLRSTQAEIELHLRPRSTLHTRPRSVLHPGQDRAPPQAEIRASTEERGERVGEKGRKEKEKREERERADCGNERRKKKNGAGYNFLFNEELQ